MQRIIPRQGSFSGDYGFLSNFAPIGFYYKGIHFNNSESAFQASKYLADTEEKTLEYWEKEFSKLNPSEAKKKGRSIQLRKDWEFVKDDIMLDIVRNKFFQNSYWAKKLMETYDKYLEEGNWWHDNYWGVCYCEKCQDIWARNKLGKILMQVRKELIEATEEKTK